MERFSITICCYLHSVTKKRRRSININLCPDLTFQHNSKTKEKDILCDKACEKWKDVVYILHKEDRELLLDTYSDICRYDGNQSFTNGGKDSKLDCFLYFYFITLLHHQKYSRNRRRDITRIKPSKNKIIQLLMSTITFPDHIKN